MTTAPLVSPSLRAAASIEGVEPVSGTLHQFDIDLEDNWGRFKRRTERLGQRGRAGDATFAVV